MVPSFEHPEIHLLVRAVSAGRLESDVRKLAGFGTRHTFSETGSTDHGIGAARRWIRSEFEAIAGESGGNLEVAEVVGLVGGGTLPRVPRDVEIANPIAIQRGRRDPDRYLLITAHYDSRASDPEDAASDAPGANDDASGTAAVLEAARLLSRSPSDLTLVYATLAGEEQGLLGAGILADHAVRAGWRVEGVLNNDMIGNSRGTDGRLDNGAVRVFAPGIPPSADAARLQRYLEVGGELDGPSRQLARRLVRIAETYLPDLRVRMILRQDRFGRRGDHAPFFARGFPAVRITESCEDYRRQHQDPRTEGGTDYGDLPGAMDFAYLASITALNVATLASLAWAPAPPERVEIEGALSSSTLLKWSPVASTDLAGYRVYWRRPTEPLWTRSRWVGNVTSATLRDVVIDDHFFGVAAVDDDGNESLVVFPA